MKRVKLLLILISFVSCNDESIKKHSEISFDKIDGELEVFIGEDNFENYKSEELNGLGIEMIKQDNVREAEKYFIEANRIEPKNPTVLTNLGNIYRKIGTERMAREYYNEALLNSDSLYFNAAYNLGLSYCAGNQLADSSNILEFIISKNSDQTKIAIANYTLATVYVSMNKCSLAKMKFVNVKNTLSAYPSYKTQLEILERKIKNCVQQRL